MYAEITNGIVSNILVADAVFIEEIKQTTNLDYIEINSSDNVFIGQEYIDGIFIQPIKTSTEAPFDPSVLTMEDKQEIIEIEIQKYLDAKAVEYGYDNILSACSYAGAPNPFQAEGQAFVAWRGNVWAKAYEILQDVLLEVRVEPTPEELMAELPVFEG